MADTNTNYFDMSDEEMLNTRPDFTNLNQEDQTKDIEEDLIDDSKQEDDQTEDETDYDTDVDNNDQDREEDPTVEDDDDDDKEADKPTEAKEPVQGNADEDLKRIMAPFRANGREIKVNNVDDVISLMQMGANYNKKMASIKPSLKLLKMLENNGLLDESKINYLIDLDKKNPGAINKLVKDSGIDPMELSTDHADGYRSNSYAINDNEMAVNEALDKISDSPSYNKTINIIGNNWDDKSKHIVANNPDIIGTINDHMQSGIYDLIDNEVVRQRTFGRLQGLSDIEAYKFVGDNLQAQGAFNHLAGGQGNRSAKQAAPLQTKRDTEKLNEKRRAASSTKQAAGKSNTPSDYSPWAMSDEEFLKAAKPNLYS